MSAGTRRCRRAESGAATVLGLSMIALLLMVTVACVGATGVVATHRRAQAAADLAALAGAGALELGQPACARAAGIARHNAASVDRCDVEGQEIVVEVSSRTPELLGTSYPMRARARAGPVS